MSWPFAKTSKKKGFPPANNSSFWFNYASRPGNKNSKCFHCGQLGHIAKMCPDKKAERAHSNVCEDFSVDVLPEPSTSQAQSDETKQDIKSDNDCDKTVSDQESEGANQNTGQTSTEAKTGKSCYFCRQIGHTKNVCPSKQAMLFKNKKLGQNTSIPPSDNDDNTVSDQGSEGANQTTGQTSTEAKTGKSCYFCRQIGHTKNVCPSKQAMLFKNKKLAQNTSIPPSDNDDNTVSDQGSEGANQTTGQTSTEAKTGKSCYFCRQIGHTKNVCPSKQAMLFKNKKLAQNTSIPPSDNDGDKTVSDQGSEEANQYTGQTDNDGDKTVSDKGSEGANQNTGQTGTKAKIGKTCRFCRQIGHIQRVCPSKLMTKLLSDQGANLDNAQKAVKSKKMKCAFCKSQEHNTGMCPNNPYTKLNVPTGKQQVEKSVSPSCSYCGVQGHIIEQCPVKSWGKGPDAESASEDKGDSSEAQPEISIPVQTELAQEELDKKNQLALQKQKIMERQKELYTQMMQAQMVINAAAPNIYMPTGEQNVSNANAPNMSSANVPRPSVSGANVPTVSGANVPSVSGANVPSVSGANIPSVSTIKILSVSTVNIPSMSSANVLRPIVSSAKVPSVSSVTIPSVLSTNVPNMSSANRPKISSAPVPNIARLPNVQYLGFPNMARPVMPHLAHRGPVPAPISQVSAGRMPVVPGQLSNPAGAPAARTLVPVQIKTAAKLPSLPITTPSSAADVNIMHHFTTIKRFPAGVPRSFLAQDYREHMQQFEIERIDKMAQINMPNAPTAAHSSEGSEEIDPKSKDTKFLPIRNEESMDTDSPKAYSPSDVYGDMRQESGSTEPHEGSESPDPLGQKRLSAFQRLGPVSAPKKPKLTINLKCNAEEPVREVVNEVVEIEEHTPVHLRNDVTTSTDDTVMKYLFFWPWKKNVPVRRTATFKTSKSAMLLEQEQMEEAYDKENTFIQITITNYPRNWTKEEVIDVLLEQVNIIPCFIEFTTRECKFLVIRSKPALLAIHKLGFKLHKDDVELKVSISVTLLTQSQFDFLPRLVLRKRLLMGYDGENKLDLQEFTLKSDISHFIYFPLKRVSNQTELVQLQSVVDWNRLTELNLSRNRLTSIQGFHLNTTTPNLKKLDLSHNWFDKVTALLRCRNLPLKTISLEGNPLCHDYTDPAEYVKVIRMLFPTVREIDDIPIQLKGDLPAFKKNFCLYGADSLVEKFLEIFYPLLEAQPADRLLIDEMYEEDALLTVVYRYKFIHRLFRIRPTNSQFIDEGLKEVVDGASAITKYINKWPGLKHDPFTFTVDVLFHSDTATLIKVCGILKLTSDNLAEDEHVISFSRTTLLHSADGVEYKVVNELVMFDEASSECQDKAFQITKIRSKKLYFDLDFETEPDDESKETLIVFFSHLTELDKNASRRCLEKKEWNLRSALDNFIQLLKLNDLSPLVNNPVGQDTSAN